MGNHCVNLCFLEVFVGCRPNNGHTDRQTDDGVTQSVSSARLTFRTRSEHVPYDNWEGKKGDEATRERGGGKETLTTCTGSTWHIGSATSLMLQTYSPPMSPQQSAAVSGRLLRSSLRHRQSSATTFRTSLLADRTIRHRRSTLSRRAFSVSGPAVWNLLPDQLRDSDCTESAFRQSLKTFFFSQ